MRFHHLAIATLAITSLTLAGCGSDSSTTAESKKTDSAKTDSEATKGKTETKKAADGPWEYKATGYDNVTIKLDKAPSKIVADAYSMQAMYPYGIRPVAYWGYGQEDVYMKELDLSNATNLGKDGEFSLEKLAAAKPDIIVGFGNGAGTGWTWWDEKVTTQATAVAPYLPVDFGGRTGKTTVEGTINYFQDLAKKLGGDASSDQIAKDKKDYETNLAELKKTLADRKDLTFALLAPVKDKVYFGQNQMAPVKQLTDAGMKLVGPTAESKPWEEASWEKMPALKADVVLINATTPKEVRDVELFKKMKASAANQVFEWDDKRPYTYRNYADWFKKLTGQIKAAKDVA